MGKHSGKNSLKCIMAFTLLSTFLFGQKYQGELSEIEYNIPVKKLDHLYQIIETKNKFLDFMNIKKGDVVAEIGSEDGVLPQEDRRDRRRWQAGKRLDLRHSPPLTPRSVKRRDEPRISARGLCPQPNAIVVVAHSSGIDAACTPKELRLIAQGCERSELPWVRDARPSRTPTGFRHTASETQPRWGRGITCSAPPQGSRDARQPWAMRRNSFGVKTSEQHSHGRIVRSKIFAPREETKR